MPGDEPVTTHRGCRFRADLRFWLNVSSSETTTSAANDKLTVEVRNTAGALLKTIRVQFRATTNSSLPRPSGSTTSG